MRTLCCPPAASEAFIAIALACTPPLAADEFLRGDADGDGRITADDAALILGSLFQGGKTLECPAAADLDDNDAVEITDATYILSYLHRGGPPPRPPFPGLGVDPTPGALGCSRPVHDTVPPSIRVLSAADGAAAGSNVDITARVRDDATVRRVLIDGRPAVLPPESSREPGMALRAMGTAPVGPGPQLLRLEAVDDAGNVGYAEVAVAGAPFLESGCPTDGAVLDLSGGAGYRAIEEILEPLLKDVPRDLDRSVNGAVLLEGEIVPDVNVEVKGKGVEAQGPSLSLTPADGLITFTITLASLEVTASGKVDYPPEYTDARLHVTAKVASVMARASVEIGRGPEAWQVATLCSPLQAEASDAKVEVEPFFDPFGIQEQLLDLLRTSIRREVQEHARKVIEKAMEKLLLGLAGGIASLSETGREGAVSIGTAFESITEAEDGFHAVLPMTSSAPRLDPGFPAYPGSPAGFAPYPGFPPTEEEVGHRVDAALCISVDAWNQLLAETMASRPLRVSFKLRDRPAPFPMTAGALGALLGRDFAARLGLDAGEPLILRIEARQAPTLRLADSPRSDEVAGDPGGSGEGPALFPEGAVWRVHGAGAPLAEGWREVEFDDAGWRELESGFGWSERADGLPPDVHTPIPPWELGAGGALHLRARFNLGDPRSLVSPRLRVQHTQGFTAYLNGVLIAERPPASALRAPAFGEDVEAPAVRVDDVPLGRAVDLLREGENVLAIEAKGLSRLGFILVPELFDRVPRAAGTDSLPAELAFHELEASFSAKAQGGFVDLVALRLSLRLAAEVHPDAGALSLYLDSDDDDDADELPDALIGGIGVDLAYEALDVDDGRLVALGELLLPWLGPYLSAALASLELPTIPVPCPTFVLEEGREGVQLEASRTTLAGVDTNGGAADWICLLSELRVR